MTTLTSLDSSTSDLALETFFLTALTSAGGGEAGALDAFLLPFFTSTGAGGGEGDLAF